MASRSSARSPSSAGNLTIAQLSQRTGIPRAAVRRCLYTLAKLGYVVADEARGYSLRPGILALGHAYLSSTPLAAMVQPLLDHISDALHESSSMAVLDSDEILYIARSTTTTRLMSIDLGIGSRLARLLLVDGTRAAGRPSGRRARRLPVEGEPDAVEPPGR